ncbi:hypothetical protein ET495_08045 [Xylanimonas allomyrinae]|uniref:Type II secretion system protein GspF domain-containing protein n=1 Tax=Xylanimonas allomyrinae TaxID=2509459 RepID=A0A4P6EYR1_9MICO|nr:type II secretion system F family protein [Xylanimonas allomyrinae]QAY63198.1 hypothetical protein ET495_08045 [Xylanimonas allomyrinae]
MSTSLALSIAAGGSIGLGVALLIGWLTPARVDLGDALTRLTPTHRAPTLEDARAADPTERLGRWAMTHLPARVWARTPRAELTLLNRPLGRFYGDKLTFAAVGLLAPPFLTTLYGAIGLQVPFVIPATASLLCAAGLFYLPNHNVVSDAAKARVEFRRTLSGFIELVALERTNGSGVRQSLEAAADIGNTWVFDRIDEELNRANLSGVAPWTALREVGDELGLPELHDFADIMRLSGEQGAAIYTNLRARADTMRAALLGEELAAANAESERMTIPGSLLGVVFMGLLIAPPLLRMLLHT